MRKSLCALPVLAMLCACSTQQDSSLKLIGGETVTDSHLVAKATVRLEFRQPLGTDLCSGTLIGPNHIVTAGHCVADGAELQKIGSGPSGASIPGISNFKVLKNPQYQSKNLANDLTLISFDGSLPIDMRPVKIGAPASVTVGSKILYAGYGNRSNSENSMTNPLQMVQTAIATVVSEDKKFRDSGNGKTHCGGDSGGSVFQETGGTLNLVGVISSGTSAGCESGIGSNMNVTLFQGWIKCASSSLGKELDGLVNDESSSMCNSGLGTGPVTNTPGISPLSPVVTPSTTPVTISQPVLGPQNVLSPSILNLPPGIDPRMVCMDHDGAGNCIRFLSDR